MGFADRVIARAAPEQRAITEWGSSAIPGPLGNMAMGGGSYASVDLRRSEAALQKVAVWSSIDLIAGVASQLPLQTFRMQPDGTGKPIGSPKFVEDPGGDDQGTGDWIYQYLGSKLMRGNAYGRPASLDPMTGNPTQIVLLHPDDVKGSRDRYTGVVTWRVNGADVPASQMWHRRAYPVAGQLLGLSPIGQHATTIGQGISAARFGAQFFTDGGHPTVVLQNSEEEIDQTKATVVKSRLMSTVWGSREPLVMGRGWDFKTLQVSPEESQFLETQKFTGAECCRIFGPNVAEILGYETGGSMTYANQEQRAIDFLKFTLNRWLRDVEAVFTRYLPRPQYVRFDRKVLLETDLISRYQAHRTARDIGLSNIDELRGMEDLAPLPDGKGADYTPLLIQVAASRGIDAAQVHAGEPPSDQPGAAARSAAPDPKDGGEVRKFDPTEPRDPHGKWSKIGGLLEKLTKAGTLGGVSFDDGDEYIDWSMKTVDGGRQVEFGAGHAAITVAFDAEDMHTLHDALTDSLSNGTDDGFGPGPEDSEQLLQWVPQDDDGQRWEFTARDAEGQEIVYDWPRSRMEQLHTALTVSLIADAMGQSQRSARRQGEVRAWDPTKHPHGEHGHWATVASALGRMTMDDFFAAHGGGDDAWHDQYGGNEGPSAILWHSGQASLYYPTGKGGSHAFVLSSLDSHSARQFAEAVDWAVKHPIDKPEHMPDGPADETRTVQLPDTEVHIGYGYDPNEDGTSDLYVTATFPKGAGGGKDKAFTMYEAGDQNASSFVDDLRLLADDIDSKAYVKGATGA